MKPRLTLAALGPRADGIRKRSSSPRRARGRAEVTMDLLEYQGKQLFARHGIPVPNGRPATTLDEALDAADAIGYPCVVKAQVQIGGRGKLGGIKAAQNKEEAREHAGNILGMYIRG